MKTMLAAAAVIVAGTAAAPAAAATTIDFNSYGGTTCVTTPVTAGVLTFTTGYYQCKIGTGNQQPGKADNGTGILINGFSSGTAVASSAIKLSSLDIGQSYYSTDTDPITITLNLAGGGTSATTILSTNSFQTVLFGGVSVTGFTVSANSGYYALDNIVYGAAVPEAATWTMLIAGFGLVGAAARRRRMVVAA